MERSTRRYIGTALRGALYSLCYLLLARSPEYPQRIRVASVFEFFDCLIVLCLLVCKFSNFSSPHLLFYSTVSSLIYWPAPSSIHRGLEWSQSLNRLSDCSLSACLQIFSFSFSSSSSYSTVSSLII